jgi:hypothetical protein
VVAAAMKRCKHLGCQRAGIRSCECFGAKVVRRLRLCGLGNARVPRETVGGVPRGQAGEHLTKWSVVTAIKIRRFATQAEAEAERNKAVERGERAYIIAPLEAWAGGALILVPQEFPWRSGGQAQHDPI